MLKVAVIGVGYLGKFHAEKYAMIDDVELIGVVDINEKRAKEIATKLECPYYTDYKDIADQVDAVSIVVPTVSHFEVASFFLNRGIHCLLEKPITQSVDEAQKLINIAKDKAVILQIGHIERFNPAVKVLSEKVNCPLFIEAHRLSEFKPRAIDVDVILDLMIHDIDIVLNLVKEEVTNVLAVGVPVLTPHVDIANVRLVFKNGCTANLTASRISRYPMRRIRVFQPGCFIGVDCLKKNALILAKTGNAMSKDAISAQNITLNNTDMLLEEIRAFIKSIKEKSTPIVTAEHGKNALELAITIGEQIKKGIKDLGLDITELLNPPPEFKS